MRHLVKVVVALSMGTAVAIAEPSVYGNTHGGFSSPDKVISQNKKTIAALKRTVAEQNERIDGLSSIVEGLSATVNELQQGTQSTTPQGAGVDNTALLKELGAMIDKINGDYVSKAELQKALSAKGKYVPTAKETSKKTKTKTNDDALAGKSSKNLYSEGVRLFVKQRYDEAKKRFTLTDTKGYKPAASNYYLGEISYYTKQYEDAIFYFKKSAGLYDKASYIDTLLLHAAVSLEKTGQKDQARVFYENIIANYKGKKTAKIAKDKLKKL